MNKWLVNILMLHVEMIPLAYKGISMPTYFFLYNLVHFGLGFTQKHKIVSCVLHKRFDIDVLSNCLKWQFVIHMYMVEYFCILHAS